MSEISELEGVWSKQEERQVIFMKKVIQLLKEIAKNTGG